MKFMMLIGLTSLLGWWMQEIDSNYKTIIVRSNKTISGDSLLPDTLILYKEGNKFIYKTI